MSKYVVLNFEDRFGDTGRGAADSTVQALQFRYENLKQRGAVKALFVGKHSVVEHRCVEIKGAAPGFTTDAARIGAIRSDCKNAAKIYVVAHGDPRVPDYCFTNDPHAIGVVPLSSYSQLGFFLRKVLPAKCTVALVMCYGARCAHYQRAQVNHAGAIAASELSTSFAYQLYRGLAQSMNIKMTAVTGKIQHNNTTGRALVEHEDIIDENMESAEADKQQTVSKAPIIAQYKTLITKTNGDKEMKDALAKFRANPASAVVTPFDQYAKATLDWENNGGNAIKQRVADAKQSVRDMRDNLKNAGQEEMMAKYGKFIYTYQGGVLRIVTKYGSAGNNAMMPMQSLYEGALL